ncbi:MAG: V-type ATP synthase subunit E [Spirochaetes bacterium]|nr:MAG: V-type ATP synthase subunit E [Spirochaetota bacterium]
MDVQLKELIEKIKTEGVKDAEEKSSRIIKESEAKAAEIISEAEKKATRIKEEAKKEAEKYEHSGKEALSQAGRDLLLSLRKKIIKIFEEITKAQIEKALKGKALEDAVVTLVKEWSKKQVEDVEVLLPPEDLEKIESSLKTKLADEIKKGLEIKPLPQIDAGFRVANKDGSAYYDFSANGIAEILSQYLNPRLAEILKRAIQKE